MDEMAEFEQAFNGFDGESHVEATPTENPSVENTDDGSSANDDIGSVTDNESTPAQEESKEGVDDTTGTEKVDSKRDVHKQNNLNAQRRIRQRESVLKQKDNIIKKLQDRLAKYEAKGESNEFDTMRLDSLRDQIEDAQTDFDNEAEEYERERLYAFNDQVAQEVGVDSARIAVPMIQRWANYVNKNERELVNLSQRPFGKHLLYEWCTRMESSPTACRSWQGKTAYEKSRILTELYNRVVEAHNPKPVATQETPKVKDVAVARSGRGATLSQPPAEDDFATAIQQQLQKRGIKNL